MNTVAIRTGTAFDDMDNDFEGLEVANTHKAIAALHPFEAKGLGVAPYACVNFSVGDAPCTYCGKLLKNLFHVKSANGSEFIVGSDCVAKTNAILGGYDQYKKRFDLAQRDKANARARQRKAERIAEGVAEFKKANPEMYAKLEGERGGFLGAMFEAIHKWGSLTPGQFAAVERSFEERKARAENRLTAQAEALKAAPVVSESALEAIETAFNNAKSAGIKYPKLRLAGFVFKPAGSSSANAGAIYVTKKESDQYLGKVIRGKFLRVRECTDEAQAEVVAVCTDPKAAAIAYGKKFGQCCVCGRELTDAASIEAGIGPICAENYGF